MSNIEASLRLEISNFQTELAKAKGEAGKLRSDLEKKTAGIEQAVLGRTEKYKAIADSAKKEIKSLQAQMSEMKITPDWGTKRADMAGFRASMMQQGQEGGTALSLGIGRGMSGAALVGVVATGIMAVKNAVKNANADESMAIRLKVLVGDEGVAKQMTSELKTLGAKTPLDFPELANAAKLLVSFGEDAKQVPETLARIGDISQSIGAPIGEIAELYGKARVQGTLFAEDINQLTGRGIPVIQEFARILGVSEGSIKKLGSEGQITFPLLEAAFISLTSEGGRFHNMMKEVGASGEGLESRTLDELKAISTEFGKPIASKWKSSLEWLLPYLGSVKRELRIINGDSSVFGEEKAAANSGEAAVKAQADAKARAAEIEAKAREATEAKIAEAEADRQSKLAEKKAKEREVELKHLKGLRDEIEKMSFGMLPDEAQLQKLQQRLGEVFFDAQLSAGESFSPSIASLQDLVKQRRASGDSVGEASALNSLKEALAIQRDLDTLQEKMRSRAAEMSMDRQKAREDAAKELEKAKEKAAEDQKSAKQRQQMLEDYRAEMDILDERVNGEKEKADAMQRSLDILREARDLQKSMKLSEDESLKLAQRRADLEGQLQKQQGGDARYDENGRRRTDGRKKVDAHIYSQDGPGGKPLSGLDQFYERNKPGSRLRDTFKFPGLDSLDSITGKPLRDTFQFPGLDAYDALQKRPTGDQAQRNAAAETARPQGDASVAAAVQVVVQNLPAILQALQ